MAVRFLVQLERVARVRIEAGGGCRVAGGGGGLEAEREGRHGDVILADARKRDPVRAPVPSDNHRGERRTSPAAANAEEYALKRGVELRGEQRVEHKVGHAVDL